MTHPDELNFLTLGLRGVSGKCPKCGQGKLFKSYLKQVEDCGICGEAWGHIRADDGPTWLTLFLVLHFLAPALLIAARYDEIPYVLLIFGLSILAILLTLLVLPRAKGLFIAILWRSKAGQGKKWIRIYFSRSPGKILSRLSFLTLATFRDTLPSF